MEILHAHLLYHAVYICPIAETLSVFIYVNGCSGLCINQAHLHRQPSFRSVVTCLPPPIAPQQPRLSKKASTHNCCGYAKPQRRLQKDLRGQPSTMNIDKKKKISPPTGCGIDTMNLYNKY